MDLKNQQQKIIQKHWLKNESNQVYDLYLQSAFNQLQQNSDINSILINELNPNIDNLSEKEKNNPDEDDFHDLILSQATEDRQYVMEKNGKKFNRVVIRNVKFQEQQILQIKKGDQRVLDMPNKIILETKTKKNDFTRSYAQTQSAQLILNYSKRDLVVFVDNIEHAEKLQKKLIYFKVFHQFPNRLKLIKTLVSSSIQKHIFPQFLPLIQSYSNNRVNNKFKTGINLVKLLIPPDYDSKIISNFISKWLHKQNMEIIQKTNNQQKKKEMLSTLIQRNQYLLSFDKIHFLNFLSHLYLKQVESQKKEQLGLTKINLCLKLMEFDQKINFTKPILKIIFRAHQINQKDRSIYRKVDKLEFTELNAKYPKQRQYFKRYYKALVKKKSDQNENYQWELMEYNKESNQTIIKNAGITFQLINVNPLDIVIFKFFDGFQKGKKHYQKIFKTLQLGEIINEDRINSQIWFHLAEKGASGPLASVFLQIEVMYKKPVYKPLFKGNSYDDFLQFIISQDSGPVEPIYHQIIKPLKICGRHTIPIFKIIDANNPGLKQSLKMFTSYIIKYYQDNQSVLNEICLIIYQFIIKDLCKQHSNFDFQIEKIQNIQAQISKSSMHGKIQKSENKNNLSEQQNLCQALKLFDQVFQQNKNLSQELMTLFFQGLPPFYRQIFWFNILESDSLIQESSSKYNQIEHEQLLAEQIYYNILYQSNKTLKYQKQIQYFQKLESQNNDQNFIVNEDNMTSISNVCCSLLFFTQCDNEQNLELYLNFCKYKVAIKLLQQCFYKYINTEPPIPYQQETQRKRILKKFTNEAYSFWVSALFFKKLICQSLILNQTKQIKEECLEFELIIKQLLPLMYSHFISIQISVIQQSCVSFLTLFSNIFVSEYLYRIWDLLVWNIIQQYDIKVLRYSILYTLYLQLENIYPQIVEYDDLIIYLRLTALLINPTNKFIELIILNLTKIQDLMTSKKSVFEITKKSVNEKEDALFFIQSAFLMNIDNLDFNFEQFSHYQKQLYEQVIDTKQEEDDINEQSVEETVANKIQNLERERDSVKSDKKQKLDGKQGSEQSHKKGKSESVFAINSNIKQDKFKQTSDNNSHGNHESQSYKKQESQSHRQKDSQ